MTVDGSGGKQVIREVLLTAHDVAEILRVEDSWVYRRAREGDLPCRRIGRYVRFTRGDIDQWLEHQSKGRLDG